MTRDRRGGLLLDTSYLYKLMKARGTMSERERRWFAEREGPLCVSAVSIWEMRLKYGARNVTGERKSPFDPRSVLAALVDLEVVLLPMTPRHAAEQLETPIPHRHPFDELLLVQAQEEGLHLLTVDQRLAGHPLTITP